MPRGSKKPPRSGGGGNPMGMPPMGMFGLYGNEDEEEDHDHDLEAELNQLLGQDTKPKVPSAKPRGKQLMDWSELNAQISASMKDDDVNDEDDLEPGDEGQLMAELAGLVSDDEDGLQAPTPTKRGRSPGPEPQAASYDQYQILMERKKMYETAIQNAKTTGQSAKVRRLERGNKTLESLLKQAKAGKTIDIEEIPPQVASGKPSTPAETPPVAAPPSIVVSQESVESGSPPKVPAKPDLPARPVETPKVAVDTKIVEMLINRQHEFKKAAFTAKEAGNKQDALKYLKILKQFDSVISAAKEGKPVDLSQMPAPPGQPKVATPKEPEKPKEQPPREAPPQQQPASQAIPIPKTLLEGLMQRQQKYKSSADQAKNEGNGGKSRRMTRIVKQYEDAIRAHKAGKQINIAELPVPMGFPPLPGINEKHPDPADMLEQAGNLLQIDDEERPQPQVATLAPAAASAPQRSPSPNILPAPREKTRTPSPNRDETRTAYQNQVEFLVNRQTAFKQAALAAKKNGDKETAMVMLKKAKGFEPMIAQAKNGLKVDISKVPQPPAIDFSASSQPNDDKFEVLKPQAHEDDDQTYKSIMDTLKEQIKKARAYSEQFTHSGDVNGANKFDRLSADSQRDYDFVKNLQRHNDPPPRYYFETKTFSSVHIIPELTSSEMELIIVQVLDLDGNAKDLKPLVEWEMPFPHDDPIKGKTQEIKSSNPKYNEHFKIPIVRKSKSFQRAMKNKAVKFTVMQKGGFLRSDKSFGTAAIKLGPLETTCEIRSVEPLREGRAVTGKIEVKIRMRTPLIGSESQTITEKWMVVSHERPRTAPKPSQGPPKPRGSPKPSSPKNPSQKQSKIGSLEVLALEKRMVEAKIQSIQSKGQQPPTSVLQNLQSVQGKIAATKKFLHDGGVNAKRAYVQYLKTEIGNLTKEAQAVVKQGKHDQAKFVLTKKKMIENELAKMAPSNTYL